MQYVITFLEGIISFISPCMLPMLPLYISYFAGGTNKKSKVLLRALGFVFGYSLVFCILGVFAGTLGSLLIKYKTAVNIISGIIVIIFGFSYLELIRIPFFKGINKRVNAASFFGAFTFGLVYSVGLTPCIGAFLGSALMLASNSNTVWQGLLLLVCYCMGLGIPFLISALLLDKLETTFSFIKKHYKIINTVCGVFLIVLGILMALGLISRVMEVFA